MNDDYWVGAYLGAAAVAVHRQCHDDDYSDDYWWYDGRVVDCPLPAFQHHSMCPPAGDNKKKQ